MNYRTFDFRPKTAIDYEGCIRHIEFLIKDSEEETISLKIAKQILEKQLEELKSEVNNG